MSASRFHIGPAAGWRSLPARALLGLLALAPIAATQSRSDGPLVGTPLVSLVGSGTETASGPLATDTFQRKTAGFLTLGPEVLPAQAVDPVFTTTALFGDGIGPPAFTVNALSLGLDDVLAEVPVGGQSRVTIPPGAWGVLAVSVTPDSVGAPGSRLAEEAGEAGGPGADLFSIVLPGSNLPAQVAACYPTTGLEVALDAPQMGLGTSSPPDLIAGDILIPLYEAGDPVRGSLPDAPFIYFSVARDDVFPPGGGASSVPAGWFGASPPSSATILATRWQPGPGTWSAPQPFLTFAQLGLAVDDDIDALAVDRDDCRALFSIVRTATSTLADQLQIVHWCGASFSGGSGVSTGDYVVEEPGGTTRPMGERMGLDEVDDIDVTCTVDPGGESSVPFLGFGQPVARATFLKDLSCGVFRDEDGAGPTITPTVDGVPTVPVLPNQQIELWLGIPLPAGPYAFLAPIWGDVIDGSDPTSTRQVPVTIPALSALLGIELDFFWFLRGTTPRNTSAILRIDV